MPSLTQSLARFVAGTAFEDLPSYAVERAKVHFLDWIAATYAGTATEYGRILLEHARRNPEPGPLTALGLPETRGARQAAFNNSAVAKASQLDDFDRASVTHPAVAVCPPALAMAELRGRSGADLLRAIVLGYEVTCRIGDAVGPSHFYWYDNTATCGTFGSAAAAGLLMGLDEEGLVGALGNAGAQAAGLRQFCHDDLEFGFFLVDGKAASEGLLSAQLAELGFPGAPKILEGPSGFFAAMSRDADPEAVTRGLEHGMSEYRIRQVYLKRWPCCSYSHTAIHAAQALSREVAPEDVESITISACGHTRSVVDRPHPTNTQNTRYSIQFGVAAGLVFGQLGVRHFALDSLRDPRIQSLLERIRLQDAPDLAPHYPERIPARVAVQTRQGAVPEKTVIDLPGGPEQPLGFDDVAGKLKECAGEILSPAAIDRLVDLVSRLERVDSVRELFDPGAGR